MGGAGVGDAVPGSVDTWAPRRMSNESAEETPGPTHGGGGGINSHTGFGAAGGSGLFGSGGLHAGYTPGTGGGAGDGAGGFTQVLPVPTAGIMPVPLSAGKGLEMGHGRHVHHGGWDDGVDQSEEGLARREAAIAAACGVDADALGRRRAIQEALSSVFC